jgi:DNA-binding NtrC family response regulator
MRKSTVVILNQLNIKNNKIDKYDFKKIITKKIMRGNTVAIHSVLKKKTTNLNSQSAQYEKNKINKDNSRKKNHKKKTMWKNTIAIRVLKKKTKKLNFQTAPY